MTLFVIYSVQIWWLLFLPIFCVKTNWSAKVGLLLKKDGDVSRREDGWEEEEEEEKKETQVPRKNSNKKTHSNQPQNLYNLCYALLKCV